MARELARKPDYIKVWFIHRPSDDLAAQEAIVKAAGDAAHAAGVPLAVHATELVTAKAALRAGADYLVHSVDDAPVDDEFIALAKKNHAIYCPTLFVTNGYRYALSDTWKATEAEQRLADPQILATMDDLRQDSQGQDPERVPKLMANPPKLEPVADRRSPTCARSGTQAFPSPWARTRATSARCTVRRSSARWST